MKRVYFLLMIAVALVTTGCKQRIEIAGVITNRYVLDYDLSNAQWKANNGAFYQTLDVPELTADCYNDGMVSVYAEFNTGTADAYQEQLPFTYFSSSTDSETGEVFNWSRLLDFDYTVGAITIYYTNNDFQYMNDEPGDWHFRVVMIW